jgi:hypothetical protein
VLHEKLKHPELSIYAACAYAVALMHFVWTAIFSFGHFRAHACGLFETIVAYSAQSCYFFTVVPRIVYCFSAQNIQASFIHAWLR